MAKSNAAELDPQTSYRDAMKHLIRARWNAVWEAVPAAVEGTDPEGVHDVRVASRRLRAAMDVAADVFPADWYRPLQRVAKEITSELGEVRDRDVQIEYLQDERERSTPGDRVGIERLIVRLECERDLARIEMIEYLSGLERKKVREESALRFDSQTTGSTLKSGQQG